jgi:hypothetical protein
MALVDRLPEALSRASMGKVSEAMKDDLPYKVELWMGSDLNAREEILAATGRLNLAQEMYDRCRGWFPGRLVTLSNRAMLMRRSDKEAPPGTIPIHRQTDD